MFSGTEVLVLYLSYTPLRVDRYRLSNISAALSCVHTRYNAARRRSYSPHDQRANGSYWRGTIHVRGRSGVPLQCERGDLADYIAAFTLQRVQCSVYRPSLV